MERRAMYQFGGFHLDAERRVLVREGVPVPLPPKAVDTLVALLNARGSLMSKDELMATVWPDVQVEENNLAQCVSLLRRALGETRHAPQYIHTISRRGYFFAE